jgi:hypothetical protein
MITDFSNRLTYFGTLDDVVYRYPWNRPITVEAIQQHLVTAAIYDKRVLVNDGYLIANPLLIGELTDISKSLLGNMMRSGNARLFARGGRVDIAGGIEAKAGQIATHEAVVNDRTRWPQIRDALEFLSREVERYTVAWPADKNMGQIFYLLMSQVRDRVLQQANVATVAPRWQHFLDVFQRFDTSVGKPGFKGARTLWERECWITIAQQPVDPNAILKTDPRKRSAAFPGYDAVRPLMNVANEMYHLAYSIGAYRSVQSGDGKSEIDRAAIGVATALLGEHPGLVEAEEQTADPAKGNDLAALNQLLLTIPPDIRFRKDFSAVTSIGFNQPTRAARAQYLAQLRDFADGKATFAATRAVQEVYRDELAKVLAPIVQERLVENFATTLMAPVNFAMDKTGAGWLIGMVIGVDRCQNRMVERLLRRRVSTALDQEGIEATQNRGAPSLASQYGLYFGPVSAEGANRILDKVQADPDARPTSAPRAAPDGNDGL